MRKYIIFILILISFSCEKEPNGYKLWAPDLSSLIDDKKVTLKWFNPIILEKILLPFTYVDSDYFEIYQSTGNMNNFRKVKGLENDKTYEYSFENLNNNTIYYFIAFRCENKMSARIVLYDIATKSLTKLGNDTSLSYNPVFSPDGKKILYQSDNNIWLLNLNNSSTTKITDLHAGNLISASRLDWMSSNEFIFQGTKSNNYTNIFKSSIATKKIELLFESNWSDYCASISPDASKIAFMSVRSGDLQLWLYNFQTKKILQLTGYSEDDYFDADISN